MTQIKQLSVKKEELDKFLRESFLELRDIGVYKTGSYGIEFTKLDTQRDTINIEEIIFYLTYKDENLDNSILDFSVQKWVKHKRDSGIKAITFDNELAKRSVDVAFFYDFFSI